MNAKTELQDTRSDFTKRVTFLKQFTRIDTYISTTTSVTKNAYDSTLGQIKFFDKAKTYLVGKKKESLDLKVTISQKSMKKLDLQFV